MNPVYIANFYDPTKIFSELLKLDWLKATEARQEYFMSDVKRSYTYGKGNGIREYHSNPFDENVNNILNMLNSEGLSYNVCFLNRYDTQKNHLGWHADDSPSMDKSHPIAVVSFGAEREIWWKLQSETGIIPNNQRQLLQNGSLFIMPAGFQDTYFHRIPKCDRVCGTRISLTFRKYV